MLSQALGGDLFALVWSLPLAFLVGISAEAQNASLCEHKRTDLKIFRDFDQYLITGFQQKYSNLVEDINKEAREVAKNILQALKENPDISRLAKRLMRGETVSNGKNISRVMDAKLMRVLPSFLSRRWFYQENLVNKKFVLGPIFEWSKQSIQQVADNQTQFGFRATSIRQIKPAGNGYEPVINSPHVESSITVDGEFNDNLEARFARNPWEIAIFGILKTKDASTVYPATHLNNRQTKPDTYNIEYSTIIYMLNLAKGKFRRVLVPPQENQLLMGKNKGSARVVSGARIQRLTLEEELKFCN